MGSLMDTFLQNPLGNPIANKPILEWFPSFGPMQFAAGGAYGHTTLWGHLLLGLAWTAAFTSRRPGHLPHQDPQPQAPGIGHRGRRGVARRPMAPGSPGYF